jgi:hypothetical protein
MGGCRMTHTNGCRDRLERLGIGLAGSTTVVGPPFASWYDTTFPIGNAPLAVHAVTWAAAVLLFISWIGGIWMTYREPDTVWECIIRSVGVPGILVALMRVSQLPH